MFPWITTWWGIGQRSNKSDHPYGRGVDAMIPGWQTPDGNARGWQAAQWYRTHARDLGITYVIFDARIWSTARNGEGWRPYMHPNGPTTDPNLLHRNHVHVSVAGNAGATSWGAR